MSPKKILVADDETSINRMITFKLQKEGFEVISAFNGREALETFQNSHFDAVILDIMMPVMDGLEVLKKMRKDNQTIPVIMLSAKGTERDVIKGLELGANDYLSKPFRPAELIMRIKKLLGD